ncbi:hypothetical protein [Pseudonocardia nigra]|uniref:hypothetical protein n=1 Tax=Pseudonocardia nigra TaxID=1921578 RepID=UPI001C5E3B38|nr:hypothetical protein [Pseudonocardia nigra]
MRAFYGAHPLHLLALLVTFAVAGHAGLRLADDPTLPGILLWFGGAVVAHDLVLFPLYALADRSLVAALPGRRRPVPPRAPVLNHVRVPALAAGLLFLLFFPGILRLGTPTFAAATGQTQSPFLERWLLLTAALFAASALVYAIRLGRAGRARPAAKADPPTSERAVDRRRGRRW